MVSLLFSTTVAPAAVASVVPPPQQVLNTTSCAASSSGFSKKIVLAPFELGQPRKFREFLTDYEEAVGRTGQGIGALPILMRQYLVGKAVDQYDIHYSSGMTYDTLKPQLLLAIENLEKQYKNPAVDPSIAYNPKLGVYGLLTLIIKDLRKFGNNEPTHRLAMDAFWKKLPKDMVRPVLAAVESDKKSYGLAEVDLNCIIRASQDYDNNDLFVDKVTNESTSGNVPVPTPPVITDHGQSAAAVGKFHTYNVFEPQRYGDGYFYSHGVAPQPPPALARPQVPQHYGRGSWQGGPRGQTYGRGQGPNQVSGWRGGYGSRTFGRGGYGNARGGFRSGPRGTTAPSDEKRCWQCNSPEHYYASCPELIMPFRPKCSRCGQSHPPRQCKQALPSKMPEPPKPPTTSAATTSQAPSPAGQCKSLKKCCRNLNNIGISKIAKNKVLAINWSKFPELDEMNNFNFEYLPTEEVTFDFEVYSPPPENSFKRPNKSVFFIKDMPKNINEEWKDSTRKYNNIQCLIDKSKRKRYPCESDSCKLTNHCKTQPTCKKDLAQQIKDSLAGEFSYIEIAESDKSKTMGQRIKEKLFAKTDTHGMPTCEIMTTHANRWRKNKNKRPHLTQFDLDFEEQTEQRALEAKSKVFKFGQFHWEDSSCNAMAMKDLMLIGMKIGDSDIIHGMLDSGASCSIINSNLMDAVGGKWTKITNTTIMGIGDSMGTQPLKSEPLSITIGGIELQPFSFYTLPKVDTGYDVILGRDFMYEYDISLFPSIRKIRIGCQLNSGENSTFFVCQKERPVLNVESIEDITCIDVPCYLAEDKKLVAHEVNKVRIVSNAEYIKNKKIMKASNIVTYLEIDPNLAGYYPNMGSVHNTLNEQTIDLLVSKNVDLKKGSRIGSLKTSTREQLPTIMASDWKPNELAIYNIMTDQEVAEAVNAGKQADKVSNNPNALLDEIKRFGNLPMTETPIEYQLGHSARIYPPRNMEEFDKIHEEWEKDKIPDGVQDAWTEKRIKAEFKLPEGELNEDEQKRFYAVIHKYRVAFVRNSADVHLNTIGEVDLQLNNPEYHKLSVKPTRWSPEANRLIKEILDGYLQSGVIKHGSGPYSSRVFVAYRRENEDEPSPKPRLVIDYRNINKALIPCSKYLAGVDTLLLKVKNHKFYSKMDLKGAYHQIGIVEDKKDITSIVTVDSQFVFNVMSFGLSVAPGYFEIFMEHCFKAIPGDQLSHYLDDCIVPADSVEDMLVRIEKFLREVVRYRIKLAPAKCEWFARRISFLGFILDEKGMRKSPEYVTRILQAPKPITIHDMMKFLGLVNFQRRFVPACSEIIAPLNESIDRKVRNVKKTDVKWTPQMEEAFAKIKQELAKDVSLAFPQTGKNAKPLKLFVDASKISIGSALFQEQEGELRPISYVSKLLSKTELRYSAYDKEILGLVRGILAHHQYLVGREFIVFTDCRNIVYLYKMQNCCPRLLRLLERLSGYNFKIEHIAGIENYISDVMSRLTHFTNPEFYKRLTEHVPVEFIPDGLSEIRQYGGADSPFETLAFLLKLEKKINYDPEVIRNNLVSELMLNPAKYNAPTDSDSMKDYNSMLKPGVSTYVIIFKVATEFYKFIIYIYFGLEQPLVFRPVTRPDDDYPRMHVMCRGQGVHFNPLVCGHAGFETNLEFPMDEKDGGVGPVSALVSIDLKEEMENTVELTSEDKINMFEILVSDFKNDDDTCTDNSCNNQTHSFVGSSHTYQSNAFAMDRFVEHHLPNLYLRRFRDPYLCPNKHTMGDFCLKVSKSWSSSGSGRAGGMDGSCDMSESYQLCLGIDTGSSISLITETAHAILAKAGFTEAPANLAEAYPADVEIRVLNGSVQATGYSEVTFPFWFLGNTMRSRHPFYVLRDEDLPCCMLLGADYLKNIDMTISCREDKVMRYRPVDLKIRSGVGYDFYLRPMYNEINEKQKELVSIGCATWGSAHFVYPPPG